MPDELKVGVVEPLLQVALGASEIVVNNNNLHPMIESNINLPMPAWHYACHVVDQCNS